MPLPVTDDSGNLLPREALLEMAHRYGAEQLLWERRRRGSATTGDRARGASGGAATARP